MHDFVVYTLVIERTQHETFESERTVVNEDDDAQVECVERLTGGGSHVRRLALRQASARRSSSETER